MASFNLATTHRAPAMRRFLPILLCMMASCTGSSMLPADVVTVEGQVTVRGNEPFTAVWLETGERNSYVLVLGENDRDALVTPRRYRATGTVYRAEWNGYPLAHLRVHRFLPLDAP